MKARFWTVLALVAIAVGAAILIITEGSSPSSETHDDREYTLPEAATASSLDAASPAMEDAQSVVADSTLPEREQVGAADPPPTGPHLLGRVILPEEILPAEPKVVVTFGGDGSTTNVRRLGLDVDGAFSAPIPAGSAWCRFDLDSKRVALEYSPLVTLIDCREVHILRALLRGRIEGQLIPDTSMSFIGVEIDVLLHGGEDPDPSNGEAQSARVDAAGFYRFEGLRAGQYWLSCKSEQFRGEKVPRVQVDSGATSRVNIPIHTGVGLSGRVVTPRGEALQGSRVTGVIFGGDPADPYASWGAQSDAQGEYALLGLPSGRIVVQATADSTAAGLSVRASTPLDLGQVAAGSSIRQDLMVPDPCELSGRVHWPDGRPASRAHLSIGYPGFIDDRWTGPETTLDEQGEFRFSVGVGMNMELFAAVPTEVPGQPWFALWCGTVEAGAPPLDLLLKLGERFVLRLVDERGVPWTNTRIASFFSTPKNNQGLLPEVSQSDMEQASNGVVLAKVPWGRQVAMISSDTGNPVAEVWLENEVNGQPVKASRRAVLRGSVSTSSQPLRGVTIRGRLLDPLSPEESSNYTSLLETQSDSKALFEIPGPDTRPIRTLDRWSPREPGRGHPCAGRGA